jgi:tRNA pseudouridine38-40 synthase
VAAQLVDSEFNARFSAKSRHYVYKILNRKQVNIVSKGLVCLVKDNLDIAAMQRASEYLLGRHDFSSFRASECQAKSPMKTVDKIEIIKHGELIDIHVSALSFFASYGKKYCWKLSNGRQGAVVRRKN